MSTGWEEAGPKFAHVVKDRNPDGSRRYLVRIYLRGEHRTNVIFGNFIIAKVFAAALDLSTIHGSTQNGSKGITHRLQQGGRQWRN